jgi:hypothetical protein
MAFRHYPAKCVSRKVVLRFFYPLQVRSKKIRKQHFGILTHFVGRYRKRERVAAILSHSVTGSGCVQRRGRIVNPLHQSIVCQSPTPVVLEWGYANGRLFCVHTSHFTGNTHSS